MAVFISSRFKGSFSPRCGSWIWSSWNCHLLGQVGVPPSSSCCCLGLAAAVAALRLLHQQAADDPDREAEDCEADPQARVVVMHHTHLQGNGKDRSATCDIRVQFCNRIRDGVRFACSIHLKSRDFARVWQTRRHQSLWPTRLNWTRTLNTSVFFRVH